MIRGTVAGFVLLAVGVLQQKPITPQETVAHVGEKVLVEGKVTAVTVSAKGDATRITFGPSAPNQTLTAVIQGDAQSKFQNVKALAGKTVLLKGVVRLSHKKPEILVNDPEQIQVVV